MNRPSARSSAWPAWPSKRERLHRQLGDDEPAARPRRATTSRWPPRASAQATAAMASGCRRARPTASAASELEGGGGGGAPDRAALDATGARPVSPLQPLEIAAQVGCRLIAQIAILLERLEDDLVRAASGSSGREARGVRGSSCRIAADTSAERLAGERRAARSPSRRAPGRARTDRCAHRPHRRASCSGRHVRSVPSVVPGPVSCRVDRARMSSARSPASLRQAEVQNLDRPRSVRNTLAGFRSRWMMPRACAAWSASASAIA